MMLFSKNNKKYYILVFCTEIVLSLIYAIISIREYNQYVLCLSCSDLKYNPLVPLNSSYMYWIAEFNSNRYVVVKKILYNMIVYSSVFPALFVSVEHVHMQVKKIYLRAFLITALTSVLPLLINYIFVFMFVPAIKPDSVYDIYYNVFAYDKFSEIFYEFPLLYNLLYFLILSCICALIGGIVFLIYKLTNKIMVSLILPIVVLLLLQYLDRHSTQYENYLCPVNYLMDSSVALCHFNRVFSEIIILLFISVIIGVLLAIKSKKAINI